MITGVIETNISKYTQSKTDATGLDQFINLAVFVLRGSLISFPYIQAAHMVKGQP